MNKQGDHIKFKKSGYYEVHRTVIPIKGKMVNLGVRLIERKITKTIQSNQGGLVESNGTAIVKFQANSFLTSNSQAYSGPVNVYSYYLNPEEDQTQSEMPGNLTGRNKDGKFVSLVSQGMLKVELEDDSGNSLQLNPDLPAELSLPIQASLESNALSIIPLWYFDASKGGWIEEGSAKRIGNRYVGTVNHFTFWNCDFQFTPVNFKFRFVDKNGNSLGNVEFGLLDLSNNRRGSGATNTEGIFEGQIPQNSNFMMILFECDASTIKTFQSANINLDLGDIVIDKSSAKLKATLLDCNKNPVTNGLVIMQYQGGQIKIYPTQGNNQLEVTELICNQKHLNLRFIDMLSLKEKVISATISNQQEIDFGNITICNHKADYLEISFNGKSFLLSAEQQWVVPSVKGVYAFNDSSTLNLGIPYFDTNFDLTASSFNYRNYTNNIIFQCSSNCNSVKYKITEFGDIEEQIKGTFYGILENKNSITIPKENINFCGSFSYKRRN